MLPVIVHVLVFDYKYQFGADEWNTLLSFIKKLKKQKKIFQYGVFSKELNLQISNMGKFCKRPVSFYVNSVFFRHSSILTLQIYCVQGF